jgi:uncharacterized protein (DUF433 family)
MASPTELVERYITEDAIRSGPADARLTGFGTHVWALISYYQQAVNQSIDQVAYDYGIPREAVEAALAYYRQHKLILITRNRRL